MKDWVKEIFKGFMRALNIPTKADIDSVEVRIAQTVESNHQMVMGAIREHDQNNKDTRSWLEHKLEIQDSRAEDRTNKQFEKIDNLLAMLAGRPK